MAELIAKPTGTRISVIGLGYLGLTHAVCMAELGHEVMGVDVDAHRLTQIAAGEVPFYEPGLTELLQKNLKLGRIHVTDSFEEAANFADIHFLCVGTPESDDGSADLSQVFNAVNAITDYLTPDDLLVGKSTVPVGTAKKIAARTKADVAWNPEFLREGTAVEDSLNPNRIVLGVQSARAAVRLKTIYSKFIRSGTPFVVTDLETAELVKMSANAMLATKLSLVNAFAEMCEVTGANVQDLVRALSYDPRIGDNFMTPGLGYGGGCLPKDVASFEAMTDVLGVYHLSDLLYLVNKINEECKDRTVALAKKMLGGSLSGKRIAVWGMAFKPGSDDIRNSQSIGVCDQLVAQGAIVRVHDPVALKNVRKVRPDYEYSESVVGVAKDADLIMLLTVWPLYRKVDPLVLSWVVNKMNILDARLILNADEWRENGWNYRALGSG